MLDIMDLKRQLAKSLKFNWNMCVSYIPYASHWSLPWATLYYFHNAFQWFAWFNMRSPSLYRYCKSCYFKWKSSCFWSELEFDKTLALLSPGEINKSLLLYATAAIASTCCWHPGIRKFWRTFVSHHTLGRIASLQRRFMEICNVPIRISRYV